MFNYILKRFFLGLISMIILLVIVYFLLGLVKSNPIDPASYNDQEQYEIVFKEFGLDKNIVERFFIYVGGLFQGNFGNVYNPASVGASSVTEVFFSPLKYTIIISSFAFVFGSIIGIILGFWAGYRSGKTADIIINIVVIFFISVPSFVLAAFLIVLAPFIGLPSNFLDWTTFGFGQSFISMLLPIFILTITSLAAITYYIRNEIKSILVSDYITNARSKGLSEWDIFKKYVWRNASIPLVTIILPSFTMLLAGSLVVEQFFGIPGTSTVIVNSVKSGESDIVMFNVLFYGFIGILIRILIDVIYVFIDPRIKYSSATEMRNFGIKAKIMRLTNHKKTVYEHRIAEKKLKAKGAKNG